MFWPWKRSHIRQFNFCYIWSLMQLFILLWAMKKKSHPAFYILNLQGSFQFLISILFISPIILRVLYLVLQNFYRRGSVVQLEHTLVYHWPLLRIRLYRSTLSVLTYYYILRNTYSDYITASTCQLASLRAWKLTGDFVLCKNEIKSCSLNRTFRRFNSHKHYPYTKE